MYDPDNNRGDSGEMFDTVQFESPDFESADAFSQDLRGEAPPVDFDPRAGVNRNETSGRFTDEPESVVTDLINFFRE